MTVNSRQQRIAPVTDNEPGTSDQGVTGTRPWVPPSLLGVIVAVVVWFGVFGIVDPVPRTAEFEWTGTFVFGSLTLFAMLLVGLCSSSFAFRALISSLVTAALLWHSSVPSTSDGFAGAYWVVIVLLAVVSLAIVLGFSSMMEKLQPKTTK